MIMIFLSHLFYFIGLLLFLANLGLLTKINSVVKVQSWAKAFSKVTKKKPEKSDMQNQQYRDLMNFNSVLLADFFWLFFGIITPNWKFFLLTLSVILCLNIFLSLFQEIKFITKFLNFTKLVIVTISVGLLVINHFHLHLDLFKEFQIVLSRFT